MRVQIKPGLRRVRRGPSSVQIGLDPARGLLVDGLTDADQALLESLVQGAEVPGPARRPSPAAARCRELLTLLDSSDVLVRSRAGRAALARLGSGWARLAPDAAAWSVVHPDAGDGWELLAARTRRTVEIHGSGRTVEALASTLRACGVGTVRLAPGRPHAVTEPRVPDDRPLRPDLAVLVERYAADPHRADDLLHRDVAHLSVVVGEAGTVVGPLVVPGRSPCLRCLDLHRRDRDPGWPYVLAQLLAEPEPEPVPGYQPDLARAAGGDPGTEETACAALAASLAALQVLALLDGLSRPACLGATLEIQLPDGLVSRRPWPAHAACGCTWPPPPLPASPPPAAVST